MQHAANLTRTLAARRREQVTLHAQAIHLDLSNAKDAQQETFTSTSVLTVTSTSNEIAVDLVAEDDVRVLVDGLETPCRYENSLVFVPTTPGRQHTIAITAHCAYSRTGEGLHRLIDADEGETYLYTHFEPTDARRVFACFDQPDMKTAFSLTAVTPSGWNVRSNAAAESSSANGNGMLVTTFEATKPLPTYIVCLTAGPYVEHTDSYERADGTSVPLRVMARASMEAYLPVEDVFRWTKAGLAWCETIFKYDYPWGKYDQIFVPEYNIGAMENPGLVTFNEKYLRRGTPSRSERENLATTILHEMAHMWFGDLVTMGWWDDLWLKESFADFIGTQAASEVTEFSEAWLSFRLGRKAWAFTADGLPTTHPIVADIPDVEAARSNFDGITYAKGACALRQLAAYVGLDVFYAATATYFADHAFSNAGLNDWLAILERASGRDMRQWSRAWLETAGTDTLILDDSAIRRVTPHEGSAPAEDGVSRPHRLVVTTFEDELWSNPTPAWIDISGENTPASPEKIQLLDTDGWTFAIVAPNAPTRELFLANLGALPHASWRASAWEQLWQAVRHATLPPESFLAAALSHLPGEREPAIVTTVSAQAQLAAHDYLNPGAGQDAWRDALWHLARSGFAASVGELQLAWRKALIAASASPSARLDIHKILDGIGFLDADQDERWLVLTNLAALGDEVDDALDRERSRDTSTRARSAILGVLAARNTPEAKAKAFTSLSDNSLSNEDVGAIVRGISHPLSVRNAQMVRDDYFGAIESWWATRTQVIASLLARGLFACAADGQASVQWLSEHPDAPGSLRRIIREEQALEQVAANARALATGAVPNEPTAR